MNARLLTANKKSKLTLYYLIYKEETISMSAITSHLNLSSRHIKRYIHELNEEIEELFQFPATIAVNAKAEYFLRYTDSSKKNIEIFHHLKLNYLKQSIYFQLLVELTTHFEVPVSHLEDTLLVSNSYLRRLVKESNLRLEPFHFNMVYTKNKTLSLTGDELSIRLFSFLFLSDAFQTIEWPFTQFPKESLRNRLSEDILVNSDRRSETKKNLLYFLCAVLTIRILNRQLPKTPTEPANQVFQLLKENHNITTLFQNQFFGKMDDCDEQTEILYFNFFVRIFISDIITTENKQRVGETFSKTVNPITDYSIDLTKRLKKEYDLFLSKEEEAIFIYYFTLLFSLFLTLKPELFQFITLLFPAPSFNLSLKNGKMIALRQFYILFMESYSFDQTMKHLQTDFMIDYTCSLIYTLLQMVKKPKIHIYLQITKDFTGKIFLEKKLLEIFNPNTLILTNDIRKCQLIISDTLEVPQDQVQVFFLESLHDATQWEKLLTLIQQALSRQLFVSDI